MQPEIRVGADRASGIADRGPQVVAESVLVDLDIGGQLGAAGESDELVVAAVVRRPGRSLDIDCLRRAGREVDVEVVRVGRSVDAAGDRRRRVGGEVHLAPAEEGREGRRDLVADLIDPVDEIEADIVPAEPLDVARRGRAEGAVADQPGIGRVVVPVAGEQASLRGHEVGDRVDVGVEPGRVDTPLVDDPGLAVRDREVPEHLRPPLRRAGREVVGRGARGVVPEALAAVADVDVEVHADGIDIGVARIGQAGVVAGRAAVRAPDELDAVAAGARPNRVRELDEGVLVVRLVALRRPWCPAEVHLVARPDPDRPGARRPGDDRIGEARELGVETAGRRLRQRTSR